MEMGVHRRQRGALEDAGVGWQDIHLASAGSLEVLQPDTMNKYLGLTGIPVHEPLQRLRHRRQPAAQYGQRHCWRAPATSASPSAWTSTRAARSPSATTSPASGLGQWYGEIGLAVNPQFFAMKTRRYMHDHGITEDCLNRTAVKAFKNGSLNPDAWRRRHSSYDEIASSPMVCDPLRKYHFCSPSEGGGDGPVPRRRRAALHVEADLSARPTCSRRAATALSR